MSIRDILHDRNLRRQKDNNMQKEGYKLMLDYIAKRRRNLSEYDVQKEEIRLLNGIKMHVDSGWVVDRSTLRELFTLTGIAAVKEEYLHALKEDSV